MRNLLPAIAIVLLLTACTNKSQNQTETSLSSGGWSGRYHEIEPSELPDNVIKLIGKDWMLVTAGDKDSCNTMTASWGGIGYVWERPAAFMFIRDSRYTYQFLQQKESYTLSFFDEAYRGALKICGTKSGRDTDKIKEAGLTLIETPSGLMSFGEARLIMECRKMLVQELDPHKLTPLYKSKIMEETYEKESSRHQLFISEITRIWVKK